MEQKEKNVLSAEAYPEDFFVPLIKKAKKHFAFGLARKLLTHACHIHPKQVWFKQQLALCTYKDEELPPRKRFDDSLKTLEGIGLRDESKRTQKPEEDAETLALGGAVYKRKWEKEGQIEHLYEALAFYEAAHEKDSPRDPGYGGINAAYILQILASRTRAATKRTGIDLKEVKTLEDRAGALHRTIVEKLGKLADEDPSWEKQNWFVVTLAEAYFGLGDYATAEKWLERSGKLDVSEWERQTTFRQLVSIARLQGIELPEENAGQENWHEAWQCLLPLLGAGTEAALSCYRGKVGLALSGGGFRASLYHLGVLARLAEMDVLRSVEVLSTVSGGSIVGAHYYLELKHLLRTRADQDITRGDYIEIVKRLQKDFLAGVQTNIRMQTLANFRKNLTMIFSKQYGRSHRLGELYEDVLYEKVSDSHSTGSPRTMTDMLVQPKGAPKNFKPKFSNWRRKAKVPVLLLNATSLNTGHNWQFTARSMGEPPGLLGSEVDKNSRYRRMWYHQAPAHLQDYRLGYAVAASACVPGLFDPLTLKDLYPDRIVRLVDGGVHDNQGVAGLLDEGCMLILCSDASGQMEDVNAPSDGLPSVLLRSNSIVMDRVRETQYQDLRARLDSHALQGLCFVHLKKDLPETVQDWIDCQDPTPKRPDPIETPYGIDPEVQMLLSGIRTDLDSFTEVEAYALMCSGYLMTRQQFKTLQDRHTTGGKSGTWGGFDVDARTEDWAFLKLEPVLKGRQKTHAAQQDLKRQLKAGAAVLFKIWKLDRTLQWIGGLAAVLAVVLAAALIITNWSNSISLSITIGGLAVVLGITVVTIAFPAAKWFFPEKAARGILYKLFMAFAGFLVAKIHLWIFDPLFLKHGRVSRLLKLNE